MRFSFFFHESVSPGPVIDLIFKIYPRIFVKILNGPNGAGKQIHEKKLEVENLVSDSLQCFLVGAAGAVQLTRRFQVGHSPARRSAGA